jgi:pilus assembly protein FimV
MMPLCAQAARLGKASVLSEVGQPVVAEIDIVATSEELVSIESRLLWLPGVADDSTAFAKSLGLRVVMAKRGNTPVLRITSERPLTKSDVGVLVELRWSGGMRLHEYLLRPPAARVTHTAPASKPLERPEVFVVPPVVPPVASSLPEKTDKPETPPPPQISESAEKPEATVEPSPPTPSPAADTAPPPAKSAPASPAKKPDAWPVKPGDSLSRIAQSTQHDGVSIQQMTVAIFRANSEAFADGNVNKLIVGQTLKIPAKDAAVAISKQDVADFQSEQATAQAKPAMPAAPRTADLPASKTQPGQGSESKEAAGKIAPKPPALEPTKDRLHLAPGIETKPEPETGPASAETQATAEGNPAKPASAMEKDIAELQSVLALQGKLATASATKSSDKSSFREYDAWLIASLIGLSLLGVAFIRFWGRAGSSDVAADHERPVVRD